MQQSFNVFSDTIENCNFYHPIVIENTLYLLVYYPFSYYNHANISEDILEFLLFKIKIISFSKKHFLQ